MNEAASAHITLRLGEVNCQSILATSYGTDGGWGEYMRKCIADAPTEKAGLGSIRPVVATADMWDDLGRWLRSSAHHGVNADAEVRRTATAWAALARRIEREISKIGNHPAYRKASILGIDRTVFTAWERVPSVGRYYATAAEALAVAHCRGTLIHGTLVPEWKTVARRKVTSWHFVPTTDQTGAGSPVELA